LLQRLWKPWFIYRPSQLWRRACVALAPPAHGYQPVTTSWGATLRADPSRTIGRSIATTGVYDLAVSEVLARLIDPGDTVIDAGANIGYMTVLAAVAAGPSGRILSFEPHPDLFAILGRNVEAVRSQSRVAPVELHRAALSERAGTAELTLPPDFESNDGVARISTQAAPGSRTIAVALETIDGALGDGSAAVMKLDVEAHELQVHRAAARALESRRIRHIVFEEHQKVDESEVIRFLQARGYRVYAFGWSMRGITLRAVEGGSLAASYEPSNYLASVDPESALERCGRPGWLALSNRLS
jgi:FkbM family methyltransferase